MLLYTHAVLAMNLHKALDLEPVDEGSYILGALLPDVRYLSGSARKSTHPEIEEFVTLARTLPIEERSMALGCLAHLATDKWAYGYVLPRLFPWLPETLLKAVHIGVVSVLMEQCCWREPLACAVLPNDAGELGRRLGLPAESVAEMADKAGKYLKRPTIERATEIVAGTDLRTNRNVVLYLLVGRLVRGFPPLRRFLIGRASKAWEGLEDYLAGRMAEAAGDLIK